MKEYNMMGTSEAPYILHKYDFEEFKKFLVDYVKDNIIVGEMYNDMVCSFDTEVTSTYVGRTEKFAFVYIWQMAFGKHVWYGRHIEEIKDVINFISDNIPGRTVVWVHNLAYDWYFIRKMFDWTNMLIMSEKKPLYMVYNNVEFRCSYLLTNMSLDTISKKYIKNEIYKKKTGDLDYQLCRTPETELTDEELEYCIYDVLVINELILEYKENNKLNSFSDFPYTKTGRVRKLFRKNTVFSMDEIAAAKYKKIMRKLTLEEYEYEMLKKAFQGGFTHANANYVNTVIENVGSVDIASSYPAVIVTKKFPMTKGNRFSGEDVNYVKWILDNKLSVFNIIFKGVKSKIKFEHFWSSSKGYSCIKAIEDNGRIVECESLITVMTNIDLEMFLKCYDVDYFQITDGYWYEPDYLPKEFVKIVLKLYNDKTKYKNKEGFEDIYKAAKEDINSCYGMMVTDINRPEIKYVNNQFVVSKDDNTTQKNIKKYNESDKRFLSYPWGVFVTAYARQKLWKNILMLGDAYIYADTDSNKFKYSEERVKQIEVTNNEIMKEMIKVANERNLDISLFMPEGPDGKKYPIGIWDFEGIYKRFKTLGAKRYLTEDNDGLHLTCAGWNKKVGVKYLKDSGDPFDNFNFGLEVTGDHSGRTESYYSTDFTINEAKVKDYLGKEVWVKSDSWIHIQPTTFSLNVNGLFARYLSSIGMLEASYML